MRAIDETILKFVVVPVASPAVLRVETFPVVAQDLDGIPLKAEVPGEEDVEVDGQAIQVGGVEGLG